METGHRQGKVIQGHESKLEAGGETQKRKNSVVVAKTLGRTQAEEKITSLKLNEKGDFLHGVTGIPVIFNKLARMLSLSSDCLASHNGL